LHFEVRVQGVPQNPQKFLNAWQEKKKPVKTAMAREARASE
jgi:murein DD-endopeptidase MepM/ murein hydrolase activator NlpD